MIKLIKIEKGIKIGKEKRLIVVNNLSEIKNINLNEDEEELTYKYYSEIDINNPVLDDSIKHLDNLWKELKEQIQNITLFEVIEKTFYYIDYIFRLNNSYKNNEGKICLPLILEPYSEEVIIYVIDSCINGKIKGKFIVEKATDEMMSFAKRRSNELEYTDWRNDIIDNIASDFRSSSYYGIIAMEKLIKLIEKSTLEEAVKKTIDFLFNDEDILKYIFLSKLMTENKVELSFYTNSLGDKFIKREPKSLYRDFVIYKNVPIYKMKISSSFYEIEIDENGFYVRRELSKEQVKLVIGK
ncbi:MAG: hypothetical protein SO083_01950 [Megamonas funiformis]|uniref:hypothetical protein n=1 Tax=Megamonas funiformis TaxID=437897 RepID=UPI002A824D66|nr:hypothetical protein [Megamonas funiformis]MDY3873913.1 hypothetical protein [Megamonas funiformis]